VFEGGGDRSGGRCGGVSGEGFDGSRANDCLLLREKGPQSFDVVRIAQPAETFDRSDLNREGLIIEQGTQVLAALVASQPAERFGA
jgi:hypothetical protein